MSRLEDLKRRIENKTGIAFGTFKLGPNNRHDYRFIVRFGYGPEREYVNFEAGLNGRAIYVTRYRGRITIRDWTGKAVRGGYFIGRKVTFNATL